MPLTSRAVSVAANLAKVLKRIADDVERQYGLRPHVRDLKPMDGVEFVYALNLTRCIGCRKSVQGAQADRRRRRAAIWPAPARPRPEADGRRRVCLCP